MKVTLNTIDDLTVVSPEGRIDAVVADDLQKTMDDMLGRGVTKIVMHLSAVTYISSACLRVIIQVVKQLDGHGHFAICGANETVQNVFDLAGITNILPICDDLETAVAIAKGTNVLV